MLRPGERIDVWEVEQPLGQGGMASVYRCHNHAARRILAAIKVLDFGLNRNASARARFVREAELLFSLDHPSIVKVRNIRVDADPPYLEMAFVEGRSLESILDEGPMSPATAVEVLRQIADALAYLHEQGVRHRDVKPSNILVSANNKATLVDFGIATESAGQTITENGQAMGTLRYVPPEWADGDVNPVMWDLYAFGVSFFEALTSKDPFPMEDSGPLQQRLVRMVKIKQSQPTLDPGPAFPDELRALVRELTAADPAARPQSADLVLERLAALPPLSTVEPPRNSFPIPPSPALPTLVATDENELAARSTRSTPPRDIAPAGAQHGASPKDRAQSQTWVEIPTQAPRPRGWIVPAAGVALVVGLLTVAGLYALRPSASGMREVEIGVATSQPIHAMIDGGTPMSVSGGVIRIPALTTGGHRVKLVVGEGCTPDRPEAWCGVIDRTIDIAVGDGPAHIDMAVTIPVRTVTIGGVPDARLWKVGDTVSASPLSLVPGRHTIEGRVGRCGEPPAWCTDGCAPGCAPWAGTLVVPWGEAGAVTVDATGAIQRPGTEPVKPSPKEAAAELSKTEPTKAEPTKAEPTKPEPAKEAALKTEPVEAAKPAEEPTRPTEDAPKGTSAARAVSNGQLASWLSSNAAWWPDAARAANKADANYLKGWDGATPPAGKEGAAATGVSWELANAYCKSRGGLAGIDAAPLTWSEGGAQPWHELRQAGGKPAWRRADGVTSTAVGRNESMRFIGFRCAR